MSESPSAMSSPVSRAQRPDRGREDSDVTGEQLSEVQRHVLDKPYSDSTV